MKTLAQIQAALQQAVRHGGAAPAGLLRGGGPGLGVYQHAYGARLLEALADNYGVLALALGDEDFAALGRAYLQAHPPTEPSIRWFGHRLAEFMDAWPALPHPALADLARLDWALRQAFDAAALPALTPEQLAATPPAQWGELPLRLQPHAQLLQLRWAVGPAWHALAEARDGGHEAELPPPVPLAHALLVHRRGLQPHWRSLDAEEAEALAAIQAEGLMLGDLLEQVGQAALPACVGWLQRWALDGLLLSRPG
jgi:hypothetical protein